MSEPTNSNDYRLGGEVLMEGLPFRITRIIHDDESLFENKKGEVYIIKESYIQLHNEAGEVRHHVLSSERREYDGPPSKIKGMPAMPWRQT